MGVPGQVVVAAVGDTFQFVPAPGVGELDVGRAARVVRQVLLGVLVQPELLFGNAQVEVPGQARGDPVAVPLVGVGRRDAFQIVVRQLRPAQQQADAA